MPIVMDNRARASVSLPLALLSPSLCLWACSPRRHKPGAGCYDGQAWHLNPCPLVALGGLCRGDREVEAEGDQRGPSERRERKKGVRREARPINPLSLDARALPSPATPCRNPRCVNVEGAPLYARLSLKKGPFGGKQFSCPLSSQWGYIPLLWASVSGRYPSPRPSEALTIHTRWATKSLNLLPHYHLPSAPPPFIIPSSNQYCWLRCSVSQKASWVASCWRFSGIACF